MSRALSHSYTSRDKFVLIPSYITLSLYRFVFWKKKKKRRNRFWLRRVLRHFFFSDIIYTCPYIAGDLPSVGVDIYTCSWCIRYSYYCYYIRRIGLINLIAGARSCLSIARERERDDDDDCPAWDNRSFVLLYVFFLIIVYNVCHLSKCRRCITRCLYMMISSEFIILVRWG